MARQKVMADPAGRNTSGSKVRIAMLSGVSYFWKKMHLVEIFWHLMSPSLKEHVLLD
jgi:hypothetical protein